MPTDNFKDEYLDASANMRHYGNARFALLTLFFGIIAGLLAAIFGNQLSLTPGLVLMLKIVGLLICVAFFIMEERATLYYRRFRDRAVDLEKILGFEQYIKSPPQNLTSSTNAIRIVYGMFVVFWLFSLLI